MLLALLLIAPAALAESRALLIGCDHFLTMDDTWPASANNVRMMATALTGGSQPLAKLTALPEGIGTEEQFEAYLNNTFTDAAEDDICYLYLSTHGLWTEGEGAGEFTLLLCDGQKEEPLSASKLHDLLQEIPGQKILILDACHSGAVIGKGASLPTDNLFAGEDMMVICSSGASEESWFWSSGFDEGHEVIGSGYFSGVFSRGISGTGGYGADSNRDGTITLNELQHYLLRNHGASTVRVYPEDCNSAVFTYDVSRLQQQMRFAQVSAINFEEGALSIAYPSISLSFTVLQPVRLGYLLVYQKDGRWDFANAEFFYDSGDSEKLPGQPPGSLEPGYKERVITLHTADDDYGEGYVLLHMLVMTDSAVTVAASTVLCIPPSEGNPELSLRADESFRPSTGEECGILIEHSLPCELTVTILDTDGNTVRRLVSREPSRPEQLLPNASSYTWSGRLQDGTMAEPGDYTLHVTAMVGDALWYTEDATVRVEPVKTTLHLIDILRDRIETRNHPERFYSR